MFMDDERAFGCAQCDVDIRTERVRLFEQGAQLDSFLDPDNERRIVMMPEHVFFSQDVLSKLATATNVAAVVVFEESNAMASYPPISFFNLSTDLQEPNLRYNMYPPDLGPADLNRNSVGRATKFSMYPFNIFRVNREQGVKIMNLMQRFPDMAANAGTDSANSSRGPTSPRYKLQSVGRMYACPTLGEDEEFPADELPGEFISSRVNSKTCLEDKTCLPIGGQSIWSSLEHLEDFPPDDEENLSRRQILAITAPMDSNAFFTDFAMGASAEISAMAVMMAVAEAVGSYWRRNTGELEMSLQPVYFGWNAQSWGYAGSGRFLKDLRDFECPEDNKRRKHNREDGCTDKYMNSLKFQQLKGAKFTVLNLGQLSIPQKSNTSNQSPFDFFKHIGQNQDEGIDDLSVELDDASRAFVSEVPNFQLSAGREDVIPLDASQSFNMFMPEADVLSVTGYNKTFDNVLYHSMFDNVTLIENFRAVTAIAQVIASAVISLAFTPTMESQRQLLLGIESTRIEEIVQCLSLKWSEQPCRLAEEYLPQDTISASSDRIIAGNYPGSFFPDTRLEEVNESAFQKLSLIRAFLAYHNRYGERETACTTDADCEDYEMEINEGGSDIHVRRVYCLQDGCVASDTYTHNAFGPGLSSTNGDQTTFTVTATEPPSESGAPSPSPDRALQVEAAWTESVWDFDFGLCGFVEDTPLFGGLILGSGLLVVIISFVVAIRVDKFMFKQKPEEEFAAIIGDPGAPPESVRNDRLADREPSV